MPKEKSHGAWTDSVPAYAEATDRPEDVLRHQLLLPGFASFLGELKGLRILDIGCGTGALLGIMRDRNAVVAGLDSSREMLLRAAVNVPGVPLYHHDLADPLPDELARGDFDGISANLVLQCLQEIERLPEYLATALRIGGWLAFSIPHPAFHQSAEQIRNLKRLHPDHRTWSFQVERSYLERRLHEKPVAQSDALVRNWHRPIRDYFHALTTGGFSIVDLDEPLLQGTLGQEADWFHAAMIPRFLFIRARLDHRASVGI